MRKILLFITICVLPILSSGQNYIKFSGSLYILSTIDVKFSIKQVKNSDTTTVYIETQRLRTSGAGKCDFEIGEGEILKDEYTLIDPTPSFEQPLKVQLLYDSYDYGGHIDTSKDYFIYIIETKSNDSTEYIILWTIYGRKLVSGDCFFVGY